MHLGRIEPLTDPDDAVAGERRERVLGGAIRGTARPFLGELARHRADKGAGVAAAEQMRHGPEEKCAVAKWLSLEAGRGQHLRVLAERGGVRRGQLDGLGDEQGIARDATARALGAQPLEGDTANPPGAALQSAGGALAARASSAKPPPSGGRSYDVGGPTADAGGTVAGRSAAASCARSVGTMSWWTAAGCRKRTSSFAGCTFTSASPAGKRTSTTAMG